MLLRQMLRLKHLKFDNLAKRFLHFSNLDVGQAEVSGNWIDDYTCVMNSCTNFRTKTFYSEQNKLADPLLDSFGRYHNYLRISLTERCNLRCEL